MSTMTSYTGNGAYCFTNSLHMCLQQAGLDARYTTGVLECLGGMAVSAVLYRDGGLPMFFPSSPFTEPDRAVSDTLAVLGWTCDEARGGTEAEAAERLRSLPLPAQLGPCNMGRLTYNPNYEFLNDADHYITLLAVTADHVTVHDPGGYPYATLPHAQLMQAWSAEGVCYGPNARPLAYVSRSNFRAVEPVTWEEVLRRGLARMRELVRCESNGPIAFSGPTAFRALADEIEAGQGPAMRGHLVWFALPLGARRSNDAAAFLRLCGEDAAAEVMAQKSRHYGAMVYPTVHQDWTAVIHLLHELAEIEAMLVEALAN